MTRNRRLGRPRRRHRPGRLLATAGLLGLLLVCLFGGLASFEPAATARWPWQVGYAVAALGCVAGILRLWRPRKPSPPGREEA